MFWFGFMALAFAGIVMGRALTMRATLGNTTWLVVAASVSIVIAAIPASGLHWFTTEVIAGEVELGRRVAWQLRAAARGAEIATGAFYLMGLFMYALASVAPREPTRSA